MNVASVDVQNTVNMLEKKFQLTDQESFDLFGTHSDVVEEGKNHT